MWRSVSRHVANIGNTTMHKLTTVTAILFASTALAWAADVGKPELPKMHKTFEANPARFAHDYVGKSFASSAVVTDIVQRSPGSYSITMDSSIVCPDVSVDAAQSFNKGDTVNLAGMVAAYSPQAMELGQCTFSRSVPVDDAQHVTLLKPPAPGPTTPEPKIIYLPSPPAPQVIYVQPASQGASEASPAAPIGREPSPLPPPSTAPEPPPSPELPMPPPASRRLPPPPTTEHAPIYKDSYPSQADTQLPPVMTMSCAPADGSAAFNVRLVTDGSVLQVVGGPRYYVINRNDNPANHILYVAGKRRDKVMYFAFDHSRFKDESATIVKAPGHDIRTKCSVDWQSVENR